ncbi:MAG: hypothetical protein JXR60_10465 [Bacteroidales bacterium]|nr:hypothetical protein [Bacteroidales bacterium]
MKFKNYLLVFATTALLFSCSSDNTNKNENTSSDTFEVPDSLLQDDDMSLQLDKEAMDEIIQNISSPVEMSALLKDEGIEFNYKFLSPTDNIDEFNTNFKQALNLGVLGADMGYLNMYNKTGAVLNYITAIKELSDELKVGQFFNFETLKRLATNSENIDSLMYISVSSFDKMDSYLRENNRSDISALLVTGVWIEGIFLATQVVKENDNATIKERIGEQGIVLEQLLIILNHYKKDKRFFDLITELEKVNTALSKVEIVVEEGEAEMVEVDGVLMAVSNQKSTVKMTDEQLVEIIKTIEELRNFVIKY